MNNLTKANVEMLGFKKAKPYTPSYYGKKSGAVQTPIGFSPDEIAEAALYWGCSHKDAIERITR
jgi:hypothetical protein